MTYTDKQIRSFLMSIDMEAWSGSTPHIRGVGRILEALREPTEAMQAAAKPFRKGVGEGARVLWAAMLDARMGEG
jgi:hypothetical protein